MDLLKLATVTDWITPTVALYRNLMAGDAVMFTMEEGGAWSARDAERLLENFGVESWGWMGLPLENGFVFSIHESQAEWAWDVLQEHGVPVR